jgi:hypothetical protein
LGRRLPVLVLATLAAAPALADTLTYRNSRFGTTITFPAELFERRMDPPANGDGMTWTSAGGASLAVYGANNALAVDPQGLADQVAASGVEITYRRVGSNWVVLSGYEDGLIFYQRFEFGADDVIHGVLIKYPESQRGVFDPILGDIAGSLGGP